MSIYVEITIQVPMDALWKHTQTPELHERWDLRFTRIRYLPKKTESEPQRFLYATRIGFGLQIAGEGESVGERDSANGSRSSALKFHSDDRRSIIREGSGYWKYIPTAGGIRFLTLYDYRTRFGASGAIFDRLVFRPLISWATAWSFDRLRLWLERGIDPTQAMRQTLVHAVARLALAAVLIYHGLVPKLLRPHADEAIMLGQAGVPAEFIGTAITSIGIAELLLAGSLLVLWNKTWPPWLCIILMVIATIGVAANSPQYLTAAFNPVSLNLATASLAAIDLLAIPGIPSARRCRRTQPETS